MELMQKIDRKEIKISVVGLGYVGLPTALNFHKAGFSVVGVDISEKVVESLKNRDLHLSDSSFTEKIPIEGNSWKVTTDFSEISLSDVVLITVPTPVNEDRTPNLTYVNSSISSVLDNIDRRKKTIVVLESTVFPGVTRQVIERLSAEKGVEIGEEVVPAYCPERVDPGPGGREIQSVAQIVGCDDPEVGKFLASLFSRITSEESTYVGEIEVAEAAKLIENVQRDIDIALANELSIILPKIGLDVEQVLDAASTKWNFHRHKPGVGVGGHCIPVDPYYYIDLAESIGESALLAIASRKINSRMPDFSAQQINDIFKGNLSKRKLLFLGYSYKPGLGDTRETPVEEMTRKLSDMGSEILIWDPLVETEDFPDWALIVEDPYDLENVDMVVLTTAHREVIELDWDELMRVCKKATVYDGRRVLDESKLVNSGWAYFGVGLPN